MVTQKIPIQTYISKDLDDKLLEFCSENGNVSKSKALTMILEKFLNQGVAMESIESTLESTEKSTLLLELDARVKKLEGEGLANELNQSTLNNQVLKKVESFAVGVNSLKSEFDNLSRKANLAREFCIEKENDIYGEMDKLAELIDQIFQKIKKIEMNAELEISDPVRKEKRERTLTKKAQDIKDKADEKGFISISDMAYLITRNSKHCIWLSRLVRAQHLGTPINETPIMQKLAKYPDYGYEPIHVHTESGNYRLKGFKPIEDHLNP